MKRPRTGSGRVCAGNKLTTKLSLFTLVAAHNGLDNFNFLQLPLKAEQVSPNPL
jgi:hypothetical protein